MDWDPVVVSGYARTPMGGFQGILAAVSATELGSVAVKAAVERSQVDPRLISRIYMGCVLSSGLGQAPARQAAIKAGLPHSVQATTVNKMCGSGMQAVIQATEAIRVGAVDVVVAGGMESMTNAPYLLTKHRSGSRIAHDLALDSMMHDGLEDAYVRGKPMGEFAEDSARDYGFTRNDQDEFAIESLSRANAAIRAGAFESEIVPVINPRGDGDILARDDEQPPKAKAGKVKLLAPAFAQNGTITAASAASISDGAASVVLTRLSRARAFGMPAEALIVASSAYAHAPANFATAPVPAINELLKSAGWSLNDVDLFEINEAFACVPMIAMRELGIPHAKLNVNGGATALGHPIGASGARIIATLIAALKARRLRRGVAAICIGGGEATAIAIERVE